VSRRVYSDLDSIEKEIIKLALPRQYITRDDVLDNLSDDHTKTSIKEAFSALSSEQRLYRVGNRSEHILIRRDLF
jgi:hypothetical protein